MRLHIDNKGMSLVELIISMAVTAIILSIIIMIISVASNSFRRTSNEVNLQMEAQIAINQLSTLIMEASDIENSTNPVPVGCVAKYIICNDGIGANYYSVVFINNKLYLASKTTRDAVDAVVPTDADNLLAEYVSGFAIALPNKTATIDISFTLGKETYSVSKKVKLRNAR